jgi:hypothetical protein
MTTREKFKRAVIEAIHGLLYDEAIEKELVSGCRIEECGIVCDKGGWKGVENRISIVRNTSPKKVKIHLIYGSTINREENNNNYFDEKYEYKIIGLPITIGRVIQAFNKEIHDSNEFIHVGTEYISFLEVDWKLSKVPESTDDDQTEETIKKLLTRKKIICP